MNRVLFSEADKYELGQMGWTDAQLGAIQRHVDFEFGPKSQHRDDYFAVQNLRFARVGNYQEESLYKDAISDRNSDYNPYDRTLSAGTDKIQFGFDGLPKYRSYCFSPIPVMKKDKKVIQQPRQVNKYKKAA